MQSLVSSLSASDRLVQPLRKSFLSGCGLSHRSGNRQPKTYVKPEAAVTVFVHLMMSDVSPETCWAIKKHRNNKFYHTVASCWFFLWDLYYDAPIHERQIKISLYTISIVVSKKIKYKNRCSPSSRFSRDFPVVEGNMSCVPRTFFLNAQLSRFLIW